MHILYIDESGSTGERLDDPDQPVFAMDGVVVRDEGWRKTSTEIHRTIDAAFDGTIPDGFELHAVDLPSPEGAGPFSGWELSRRTSLALDLLISRRTLLAAQGAQALLYAAVAFPLGLLLGLGLAKLAGRFNGEQLPGVEFPARLNDGAIWLGLAVALVGALVLLALSQDHRVDRRASLCVRTRDRRDHSL
jgi:hypothetical protein